MNSDQFKGKWNQFKGKVKEKWGKLTDDEITKINGKRDLLLGRLQERYGWEKEQAEEELKRFESTLEKTHDRAYDRGSERSLDKGSEKKGKRVPFNEPRDEEGYSDKRDDEDFPKRKVR